MAWNVCVAGDPHDVYSPGNYSLPSNYPYQGNPPYVNPDPSSGGTWPAANPNIFPEVKYGIVTGPQANIPIKVGGVTVGNFGSGASGGIYQGANPGGIPYPPPCPNNGQTTLAVKSYPPVVNPQYPAEWLWVETVVYYQDYHVFVSFVVGGTYHLDPTYTPLYQQYGKTDPLLLPGGPQFLITIQP